MQNPMRSLRRNQHQGGTSWHCLAVVSLVSEGHMGRCTLHMNRWLQQAVEVALLVQKACQAGPSIVTLTGAAVIPPTAGWENGLGLACGTGDGLRDCTGKCPGVVKGDCVGVGTGEAFSWKVQETALP
jgi:hypothetical protein